MKAIFRVIIGLIFGIVTSLVLSPALATIAGADSPAAGFVPIAVVVLMMIFGYLAPTIRRAFGRGFLILGAAFLFLPISTIMLSASVGADMVNTTQGDADQAAAVIGGGMAAAAMTGAATILGFILGGICLIVGLVLALGGKREVIVIEKESQA